jgi:prepilin-type N-terminal cleavage/methylation domain-containing protein/prepilin-type processing-associated H-X9-DG protein
MLIIRKESQSQRTGLTLIEFLVVCAIIAILVALMLPGTRGGARARRSQCKNNLKQLGLALHNYHDTYGSFPPAYTVDEAGNRLHSWRTLILPYVDQAPLYETIDLSKPWDDPVNAQAFEASLYAYQCPSATIEPGQTTYMAIVGDQHAFSETTGREISEIKDGTSNTVMVIEVAAADTVHWMSPHDVDGEYFSGLNEDSELSHLGGLQVLFADGSVQFVSIEGTSEQRNALSTIVGDDESWPEND